ncbi:uncharacterized protein A4U43_C02F4160 [Asparagus officinalis]|uniref:Non-specific lipid-transfer protein n=1 Tax=Asparagus officinalis TaxID=4686 RepID=A0A5P1FGL3_ASPOF|nr:non-specific lipid-transfer protein 1-like [Asparagus officinalis]ONK77204.1 uncharacterized protein A4U43_C02F4160 [Asparagus officinalis]
MARSAALFAILFAFAWSAAPYAEGAITCGAVDSKIGPCVSYVMGKGPLPAGCCSGIRSLNSMAKSTPDRQQACNCLKSAAAKLPGLKVPLAAGLPGKCGVSLPYSISTSINCATVH